MHKQNTKKKGNGKFFINLATMLSVVVVALGLVWYKGLLNSVDVERASDDRMRVRAKWDFEKRETDIENTPNYADAAEKRLASKTKLRYDLSLVDKLPDRCPETKGWEGDEKYLHLGGCKPDEAFMLVLVEDQDEEQYEAMLFFYGKDSDGRVTKDIDKLLMSPYHPFIEPYEIGKLNLASLISPPDTTPADYKLRGRVRFLYGGEGDVLRLRRKVK